MTPDLWNQIANAFANEAGDTAACRLCSASIDIVEVDGAGITLMNGDQSGPLCIAGHGAEDLEELQFSLGEGPCHDAFRLGQPVLITEFDAYAPTRWLPFAELATRIGVGSVFAFPLTCDATKLGVLTLYRRRPGPLSPDQERAAAAVASVISTTLMAMQFSAPVGQLAAAFTDAIDFRAEIHQASGMVAARLDIPVSEALVRIRAHAYAHGQSVNKIASEIIAGRLHLEDDRIDRQSTDRRHR